MIPIKYFIYLVILNDWFCICKKVLSASHMSHLSTLVTLVMLWQLSDSGKTRLSRTSNKGKENPNRIPLAIQVKWVVFRDCNTTCKKYNRYRNQIWELKIHWWDRSYSRNWRDDTWLPNPTWNAHPDSKHPSPKEVCRVGMSASPTRHENWVSPTGDEEVKHPIIRHMWNKMYRSWVLKTCNWSSDVLLKKKRWEAQ